jgi:hypothetical protein
MRLLPRHADLATSHVLLDVPVGWEAIAVAYLDRVAVILPTRELRRWYILRSILVRHGQLEIGAEVGWPSLSAAVVRRLHAAGSRAEELASHTCDICGAAGARLDFCEVEGIVVRCPSHSPQAS